VNYMESNTLEKFSLLTSAPVDQKKADAKLAFVFAAISDAALLREIRRRGLLEASSVDTIKQALAGIQ
jgi:hypothetical protein